MRISALEEYGIRCLVNVAFHHEEGEPVSANAVAEAEGLSVPYAQKILRLLSQAGFVESRRGVNGGYVLARDPADIFVGQVLRALDVGFDVSDICERHTGDLEVCTHSGACTIKPMWSFIAEFVAQTLDGLSLAVLLRGSDAVVSHLSRVDAPRKPEMHCPVADLAPVSAE